MMDAFMRKLRHKEDTLDEILGDTEDPSELALAEDDPFTSSGFAGKLTFAGADGESVKDIQVTDPEISSYPIMYKGSGSGTCRVAFEVTSAEVIKDVRSSSVLPGNSSHVDYTITVSSNTGLKDVTTRIIRRYSDFEHLHKALKKRFSNLLSGVVFPQKVFMGNFTSETIAKRSRAFEQYLTHLYSIFDVRYSSEFTTFFTGEDYSQAMQVFVEGKYFNTIVLLESYLPVVEKLYGNSHKRLGPTLCALVVSHAKTHRPDVADAYATLAMESLPDSTLTLPLLQMLARIRWSLGRDKVDVEDKLQRLKDAGKDVDTFHELEGELCRALRAKSH